MPKVGQLTAPSRPYIHYVEPYFGGGAVLLVNGAKTPLPLKWHGGKRYLADWIVSLFPPRNPKGISEVVNDLNGELMNFWTVLQGESSFNQFRRLIEAVPFSEASWKEAAENSILTVDGYGETVHRAATFFIRCRQSLSGRLDTFTGITKTRVRNGINGEVSAWLSTVEGLPVVHRRLRKVLILCRDALDVIRGQDDAETLFYLDPPYLHETRKTTGEYLHEMMEEDHRELLASLTTLRGRFLLSGYRSELYDTFAVVHGWRRYDYEVANNAAGGKTKRRMIECVWTNFPPP